MASAFGHALVAITIGKTYSKKITNWKFWTLGTICAILPDADVISFKFGIPYASFWGHRGFSHSLVFALIIGILVTLFFYKKHFFTKKSILYISFFTLCTASHSVLDAMTNGGLGVAFFSPFDTTRYFFSWRPIKVSPIGIERFFGERGKLVIFSELVWIGIPSATYIIFTWIIRSLKSKK